MCVVMNYRKKPVHLSTEVIVKYVSKIAFLLRNVPNRGESFKIGRAYL